MHGPQLFPYPVTLPPSFDYASHHADNFFRWIESERDEALLGKGVECDKKSNVRHIHDAFLGFGSGPRVCPGKVLHHSFLALSAC